MAQANAEHFKWIEAWFADIFQNPTDKKGTSLAFRGDMGTGKTIVGKYMRSMLGAHYTLVSDPRYVTGQFNSHVTRCLLLHADEAFWAGDRRAEGKLKDLITGDVHFIEFKGREPYPVPNHLRFLVSGNPDWIVPAGLQERRFATFETGTKHQEDHAYFAAIDREMRNGGSSALLHHFLNLDISKINLRRIPKTEALIDQKLASMNAEQSWWFRILHNGVLPGDIDGTGLGFKELIYSDYIETTKAVGHNHRSAQTQLGRFLAKVASCPTEDRELILFRVTGRQRGEKLFLRRAWRFPSLAECRDKFSQLCPGLPPWGEPSEWCHDPNFSVTDPTIKNEQWY